MLESIKQPLSKSAAYERLITELEAAQDSLRRARKAIHDYLSQNDMPNFQLSHEILQIGSAEAQVSSLINDFYQRPSDHKL